MKKATIIMALASVIALNGCNQTVTESPVADNGITATMADGTRITAPAGSGLTYSTTDTDARDASSGALDTNQPTEGVEYGDAGSISAAEVGKSTGGEFFGTADVEDMTLYIICGIVALGGFIVWAVTKQPIGWKIGLAGVGMMFATYFIQGYAWAIGLCLAAGAVVVGYVYLKKLAETQDANEAFDLTVDTLVSAASQLAPAEYAALKTKMSALRDGKGGVVDTVIASAKAATKTP